LSFLKESNLSKLYKDILMMAVSQASILIIPLIIMPFLTDSYSISDIGYFILSLAVAQLGYLILDFGLSTYGVKKSRDLSYDVNKLSSFVSLANGAKAVLLIGILLIGIFLNFILETELLLYILLTIPSIFFQSMIPYWLFQSLGSVKSVLTVNLISRLIFLCLCFLLSSYSFPIEFLIFFNVIGWFVSYCISRYILKGLGVQITLIFNFKKTILFFKEVFHYYTSRLSVIVYTSLNVIIVGAFLTPVNIAFYGLSEQLYKVIQGGTGAVNQAIYPILTKLKSRKTFYFAIFFTVILGVLLVAFTQVYASLVVDFLYGPQYFDIVPLIKLFSFLALINSINVMLGFPAAALFGGYKWVNVSSHLAAASYLLLVISLFYLDKFNINSLIICLILADSVSLLIRLVGIFISVKYQNSIIQVGR